MPQRARHAASIIAIVAISALAGMLAQWRVPGLSLYAHDWLMRARGPLALPGDIAIVAIDEASIARLGRFPWPRSLVARGLDMLTSARPKAIALDILYSEPTIDADDGALAAAIMHAGNVVAAAQLTDQRDATRSRPVAWLRPIPMIERAAAAVGHVNVSTELDGVARALLLQECDSEGRTMWAIAVEAIRVGDGAGETDIRRLPGAIQIDARSVPVQSEPRTLAISSRGAPPNSQVVPVERIAIDYIGPVGSFAPQTYSFASLLDGRVPMERFHDKYVLIGATAATLGEQVASPFLHQESNGGNQNGALMPGVEVLANSINTILRKRFYSEVPDWVAVLCAGLVALIVVAALSLAQGRHESVRQLAALGGLMAAILVIAYAAFEQFLLVPPLVPAIVSFATAAPLALLRRSLATSAGLDLRIAELVRAGAQLSPPARPHTLQTAALITRLSGARAVAIFARTTTAGDYQLVASHGALVLPELAGRNHRAIAARVAPGSSEGDPLTRGEPASSYFSFPKEEGRDLALCALKARLDDAEGPSGALGVLILAHAAGCEPPIETLSICIEIAASEVSASVGAEPSAKRQPSWWALPRGAEWKTRTLGALNRQVLARSRFVDRALRSVEDGLIVAGVDGRIAFVNPRAAAILGVPERALLGSDLVLRIAENERAAREILLRLFVERAPLEREITLGAPPRYYILRLSPVCDGEGAPGAVLGMVASLSDITKQRELQQMKTDVMALVTHELRTPLTAIQGMSELLAQFEVDAGRRREMHLAINDEAKRLARMIDEYLDLTRLESGTRPLRLTPVRMTALVERALMMLDPVAAQRQIQITRRVAPDLPALLADADLLARALTNLVANAIKYSPPNTEVIVEARITGDTSWIHVTDHGYGIPRSELTHIFEKFYRVPRVEDADVRGAGLGLALAREIMERHGGRVTVESEPGVGSTFSLGLPINPQSDRLRT